MTTIYVTYSGNAQTRFDREYFADVHLPMVREIWAPLGLERAEAFFPWTVGDGTIALCECKFRDEAAVEACFASPETNRIMDDVARYTDVVPQQSRVERS